MKAKDLKNFKLRTDLVDDISSLNGEILTVDDICISKYDVDKKQALKLGKKSGKYITISFFDVTDSDNYIKVKSLLKKELTSFFIDKDKILFVGLGNALSTPDSLGSLVVDDILVTGYLEDFGIENGFKNTAIFKPGVTGSNGIDTVSLISSVVKIYNPSIVVVIDALATSSIKRLCRTIQITDTGINPGSGVLNSRGDISFDTLKVPVLAIGVPTVVDTINIILEMFKELDDKCLNKLLDFDEVSSNLMVTPKEIDFVIKKIASLISSSLNEVIHEKYTK